MGVSIYVDENTQAGRVIKKFGNARRLAALMEAVTGRRCDPSRIYRWTHPRDKGGTGGLIPSSTMADVMKCARLNGIVLTEKDLYPKVWAPPEVELAPDAPTGENA